MRLSHKGSGEGAADDAGFPPRAGCHRRKAALWYNPSGAARSLSPQTMDDPRIARTYYVSGIVQGVGYRHFIRRVAETLGVTGYARNLRDGRVEIYAIAAPEQLDGLRKKLEQGPASAAVTEIYEEPAQLLPRYDAEFTIEH
ncbi:MAG TPA: acylphosphatase [Candidatus Acidoferrales bacterium]|nr:acylphosphatase [Candidatus Acidoferrales bacterium]